MVLRPVRLVGILGGAITVACCLIIEGCDPVRPLAWAGFGARLG